MIQSRRTCSWFTMLVLISGAAVAAETGDSAAAPKAYIDGNGIGWQTLGEKDFTPVNGAPDTWKWKDGVLHCTGQPVGVTRSQKQYTNFELVAQWKHLQSGGNSGIFVWTAEDALKDLKPGVLPKRGFEVQILDHGYTEQYEKSGEGRKATWFTTNGDVFPVGSATFKPFAPTSPSGERSFPRKNLSKGFGQWNHYYVRAINGEIRLWVNGEEVSGGNHCDPRTGFLCLESEGAPVEFKNLRMRELP
jgi:3-keto-disaccharide hydrolase